MDQDKLEKRLSRALFVGGDTHTLMDIFLGLQFGKLQSFAQGNAWAVTQIAEFPQKKILEIILAVGEDVQEVLALEAVIIQFCKMQGIREMRAYGRPGWRKFAKGLGWKETTRTFTKFLPPGGERT